MGTIETALDAVLETDFDFLGDGSLLLVAADLFLTACIIYLIRYGWAQFG